MKITTDLTDEAVLKEIGQRLERQRIDAGLTQARLAAQSGVAKRTLERIEAGASAELVTLLRLLRTLRLVDGVETLVPEPSPSPIALLKSEGRRRKRVSGPRVRPATSAAPARASGKPWIWGE
jgi:transcriptional regulator with XRE-family HTH domain